MANSDSKEYRNKLLLFYLDRLADMDQKEEFGQFYGESFEKFLMESNPEHFEVEDLVKAKSILAYEKNMIKGIAI